jgi:hypothetical protein
VSALASTQRIALDHPDTGEPTEAWLCACDCPPHPDGMCILQVEEGFEHVSAGDLICAHLSCVAPNMEPVPA